MRTILVRFYNPDEVIDIDPNITSEAIKNQCFRINHYESENDCLYAYAETPATWSTILDDNDEYHKFIDDAWEHIKRDDYDWLEEHFV